MTMQLLAVDMVDGKHSGNLSCNENVPVDLDEFSSKFTTPYDDVTNGC